jgi:hypothetical protein
MATPTLSAISPSTGPASGGNVCELVGTNFKEPTVVITVPMIDYTPTVRVTVNGVVSPYVEVTDSTHLRFIAPRYLGTSTELDAFPAVSVRVDNLDSTGAPIAGENVTKTAFYTYKRFIIGSADAAIGRWSGSAQRDPPILRVLQKLIDSLKREVTKNVAMSTHVDYGDEGSATLIDVAELPSIGLKVDIVRDVEWSEDDNGHQYITYGGRVLDFVGQRTFRIDCDLTISGTGTRETMFLLDATREFVDINPYLEVPGDPILYPTETNEYPIEITQWPRCISNANDLGIVAYSMGISVRGIPVLPDEPIGFIKAMTTFVLVESGMDGVHTRTHTF